MKRPDYPIHAVQNVRDLLAVAIAPELARFMLQELGPRYGYPNPLNPRDTVAIQQEMVAFVLDSLTPRATEDLLTFKRRVN